MQNDGAASLELLLAPFEGRRRSFNAKKGVAVWFRSCTTPRALWLDGRGSHGGCDASASRAEVDRGRRRLRKNWGKEAAGQWPDEGLLAALPEAAEDFAPVEGSKNNRSFRKMRSNNRGGFSLAEVAFSVPLAAARRAKARRSSANRVMQTAFQRASSFKKGDKV